MDRLHARTTDSRGTCRYGKRELPTGADVRRVPTSYSWHQDYHPGPDTATGIGRYVHNA